MKKILLLLAICICAVSCGSNTKKICDRCHGTGICQACDGDGIFTIGNNITGEWENSFCNNCGTSGKCSECGGSGWVND